MKKKLPKSMYELRNGAYQKMLFVWVALYGLVNIIGEYLPRGILLAVYDLLFVFWIFRTGRQKAAGLRKPVCARGEAKKLLLLAVFPVCNVLTADAQFLGVGFLLYMLCVSLTEELFFRGFLLSRLRKLGTVRGVLLTSIVFALLHSVNFFETGNSLYTWLQILSSFFVSICYCAITIRIGSILPCALAHFLTNITGTGSIGGPWARLGLLVSMIIYALWSWLLIRVLKYHKKETEI